MVGPCGRSLVGKAEVGLDTVLVSRDLRDRLVRLSRRMWVN